MTKDIVKKIKDEIHEDIKEDLKLCEQEQDPIKKTVLLHRMEMKMVRNMIHHITVVSDKEFLQLYKEIANPVEKQFSELLKNEKNIAYDISKNAEQFEQFKAIQDLELEHNNDFINLLNEYDFDKKSLERLLVFFITILGQTTIEQRLANVLLHPLLDSTLLVNRLFGFDINWLIGMALIQLHENMIKMKYDELGGTIKKNESLSKIISHLIGLIKYNENRDVTLSLDMSHGLKQIRNRLTHEGFKHNLSQNDLKVLLQEIKRLEQTLYPEKNEK